MNLNPPWKHRSVAGFLFSRILEIQSRTMIVFVFLMVLAVRSQATERASKINFDRDIRPILSENCFHCHGADANKRKGKLRLDVPEGVAKEGIIVPGRPDESKLVQRIFSKDLEEQMPPPDSNRHLTDAQKELLRAWIKNGGAYDQHWAFKAPVRPALPAVKRKGWARNPVDYFVLSRLEAEKLSPSGRAPINKLLRRVSLDLTGLPPTREQVKTWLSQSNPYEAAVNELLASPHFGERMASDWMDVARYADTHGFNNDAKRSMWRWRDWMIEAFNRNLPYDRFVTEQLAGDLLKSPTLDQRIATGFNRSHVINSEGGIIDEEYRVEYVVDRVQTTSLAWLGLTTGCARCHDHKFDPITQKDFYRFFAFFNNNDEWGEDGRIANASPIMPAPTSEQQAAMAKRQTTIQSAEVAMKALLAKQDWSKVALEKLSVSGVTNAPQETNRIVALDRTVWSATNTVVTNLAGGKPFQIKGEVHAGNGPLNATALVFDGGSLKAEALPKAEAGKGWTFSSWVRRDGTEEGALLSSMDFGSPPSSVGYGEGAEILLDKLGAVEVRMAAHWPAYSLNLVTRDVLPMNEWRHLLVTCDGSIKAKGVRVFIDGRECFATVIHDDLTSSTGFSRATQIGASGERGTVPFIGVLADLKLVSGHGSTDVLALSAHDAALRLAVETGVAERRPYQTELLQRAWMERENVEFGKAAAQFREARAALLALEREAPSTMVMQERAVPRQTFVLFRGQYDQPREAVEPGVPEFLLPFPESAPRNRVGLAKWLTDPRQPLTARVVVNRFWQGLFGDGIVKSVEDFGYQADWPSHPELLDWLAMEFIESGWDVKRLMRLIVTSATYCQDSKSTPVLNERDPENRLLARGPRQRLTAEMLRDQALMLSGLFEDKVGGPPVYPYQPTNLYKGIVVEADYPGTSYTESKGGDLYRRSLYSFWKRTVPNPSLATFDLPDREVCVARRLRTNTPLQALALMNDTIQLEASRKLAERMLREGGEKPPARIDFAFERATSRRAKAQEMKALLELLKARLSYYRSNPEAAKQLISVGASQPDGMLSAAEVAAYANVASLILNLDETLTRN